MAIVNGKYPQCGAVTKVNETKETAFCTQCGNQINVQQSIYLLKAAERARPDHAQAGQTNHTRTTTSQRRENRERAAEKQVMEAETRQKVSDWLQMCSTEQDFLMLRKRILDMALSEREKGMLLSVLDEMTKQRLKDTLKKAADYKSSLESPVTGIIGAIVIAAIGLAINYFFSMKWPGLVCMILAVLALIGFISDHFDKKGMEENKKAAELIEEYRKQGYKL